MLHTSSKIFKQTPTSSTQTPICSWQVHRRLCLVLEDRCQGSPIHIRPHPDPKSRAGLNNSMSPPHPVGKVLRRRPRLGLSWALETKVRTFSCKPQDNGVITAVSVAKPDYSEAKIVLAMVSHNIQLLRAFYQS